MLSSMFSQEKQDRLELKLEIAEMIETLVRVGVKFNNPQALDLAESFGELYLQYENNSRLYHNQTLGTIWTESCPHPQ
jgi:hypothetical protein